MDEVVLRALAKWPDVPDVYGWLALDRRGNWLLRGERIGNRALRDFIGRNYAADGRGCWYFQNGPQRVFAALAYTPLVLHLQGDALFDHCGRTFEAPHQEFVDEEGSVLVAGASGVGLLDDRDLARYVDARDLESAPRIRRLEAAVRFGFIPDPGPDAS